MTGYHNRSNHWAHSPFKTLLRKLGDKFQSYSTTHKIHTMTTCHGGTAHTGKDWELDSHVENTGGIDIGLGNDNERANSWDTTIALGGLEADGHLCKLLHNSQANLTVLTREINSLQQWVEAWEGQPMKGLDHIEQELWNLSLMLRTQLTSTPAPSEHYGEVIHQYMDTLCTTQEQKQTNLTNYCYRTLPFPMNAIQQN